MTNKSLLKDIIQKHVLAFYVGALAVLITIPLIAIYSPPELIFDGIRPFFWLTGFLSAMKLVRDLGKNVSRNTSHDSILLFRYALLAFFGVMAAYDLFNYVTSSDDLKTFRLVSLTITSVIVGLNILGIYIHKKKRAEVIKNVRKEELFQ